MKKALIIHNPKSGTTKADKIKAMVLEKLSPYFDINYQLNHSYEEFKSLLSTDNFNQYQIVIAIGGDGTINAIAKELIKSNAVLGIIPTGSGNGFANTLGISSIPKAIAIITKGNQKKVDAVLINNQLSFNVSGIGFDAEVAQSFGKHRKRGFIKYLKIILTEYKHKSYPIKITANGETTESLFLFLSIANSNQWGNNIIINPNSSLTDGIFELIGLKKMSIIGLPKLLYYILKGKLIKHPKAFHISASHAIIEVKNAPLHIDGDYFGNTTETITVQSIPNALKIISEE